VELAGFIGLEGAVFGAGCFYLEITQVADAMSPQATVQTRPCQKKRRSARSYVIIRDGTPSRCDFSIGCPVDPDEGSWNYQISSLSGEIK